MTSTNQTPKTALQGARWEAGLSLEEAVFRARIADPDIKLTAKTLQRYESGDADETTWNARVVLAVCVVYGVDIHDVSEIAAGRNERLADLVREAQKRVA